VGAVLIWHIPRVPTLHMIRPYAKEGNVIYLYDVTLERQIEELSLLMKKKKLPPHYKAASVLVLGVMRLKQRLQY